MNAEIPAMLKTIDICLHQCWVMFPIELLFLFCSLMTQHAKYTVRCWNSQARIIFVATLGNMPRFFCRFLLLSSSSSSPVPSPEPMLASPRNEPEKKRQMDQLVWGSNNEQVLWTCSTADGSSGLLKLVMPKCVVPKWSEHLQIMF